MLDRTPSRKLNPQKQKRQIFKIEKRKESCMKQLRFTIAISIAALLVLGWLALSPQGAKANFQAGSVGTGSFLTNITDANTGAFSSRSVITLHADHTVSVVDSGQEGGGLSFSGQQGSWRENRGSVSARTLDFSFAPNSGIARVDYQIASDPADANIHGTITLTVFPLNGNPLDGGGTVVGQFNFTGQPVTAP
jgi:hypothetical protein